MIGIGTSLLFGRKAGKAGPPIPPFNKAMVDAWFMSGLSNNDKPSSIRGVKGNEVVLKTLHLHQKADLEKEITRMHWYSMEWMITVYVLDFLF